MEECTCGPVPTFDPVPLVDGGRGWHIALPDPRSLFGHERDCPAWRLVTEATRCGHEEKAEGVAMRDATPEMIETPEFKAIYDCIKTWDINVPEAYGGYCAANGSHVRAIIEALRKSNGN